MSSIKRPGGRTGLAAVWGLAGLLAVLTGCGPSLPQPPDAEQVVRTKITAESGGRIKVVQFKTTTEKPLEDTSPYRWRYDVEIEFTEDCKWHLDRTKKMFHVSYRTAPATDEQVPGRLVKKGERWLVTGNMAMVKSEGGWEVRSISLVKHSPKP